MNQIVIMNKAFRDVKLSAFYNSLSKISYHKPKSDFIVDMVEDEICCEIMISLGEIDIFFLNIDGDDMIDVCIYSNKNHYKRQLLLPIETFSWKEIVEILKDEFYLQHA
jgi:hypothetical protein